MKILLTGAFGNIGSQTLEELLKRGHQVRCFDVMTKTNQKTSKKYARRVEVIWGDLRNYSEVAAAVADQEVVIHLAFVIPRLSITGVNSEDFPEWAEEINVGGTRNLITALQAQPSPSKLLFSSSLHIYGKTQDQPPPRTIADPPQPIEHYAIHKVICEKMIKESGLDWTIFRLGASLPVRLIMDPGMFEVPLDNRIEFVHSKDVAMAIANALQHEQTWGQTWLIGGGPRCQYYQRELVERVLQAVGIGMLPDQAFTKDPYPVDWLDTSASQKALLFQRHTLQDYIDDVKHLLGIRRVFIWLFRPIIRAWLLTKSPVHGPS